MEVDPCAAAAGAGAEAEARQFSLSLTGAAAEGLPHNYGLRRLTDVMASHVFSEPMQAGQAQQPLTLPLPRGSSVAVEGLIERKFDLHLTDAGDAEYRRLSKARTAAASSKTRLVRNAALFTLGAPSDSGVARRGGRPQEAVRPTGRRSTDDRPTADRRARPLLFAVSPSQLAARRAAPRRELPRTSCRICLHRVRVRHGPCVIARRAHGASRRASLAVCWRGGCAIGGLVLACVP